MQRKGSIYGLSSGLLWGLDTVLLGVALSLPVMLDMGANASLVSTFLHDGFSFFVLLILVLSKGKIQDFIRVIKSKSGIAIIAAALLGGPIGMGAYILSIKYIGAALASSVSAIYPAIGAVLAFVFLKERVKTHSIIGLGIAILAISLMGFTSNIEVSNLSLGLMFLGICIVGWGSEAVIINAALKEDVPSEIALLIRQLTSFVVYLVVVMPFVGFNNVITVSSNLNAIILILISGLLGTYSYLNYYKSIDLIGATQAMGLNISYPAWAFIFQCILFQTFDGLQFVLIVIIMIGSIMSNDKPKEFLMLLNTSKSNS